MKNILNTLSAGILVISVANINCSADPLTKCLIEFHALTTALANPNGSTILPHPVRDGIPADVYPVIKEFFTGTAESYPSRLHAQGYVTTTQGAYSWFSTLYLTFQVDGGLLKVTRDPNGDTIYSGVVKVSTNRLDYPIIGYPSPVAMSSSVGTLQIRRNSQSAQGTIKFTTTDERGLVFNFVLTLNKGVVTSGEM